MLQPPRNRKPAGDVAQQIEPPPSRSGRCLDYESSGSPRLSRSYRRPETESLPVTEVTGSNLRHARPGAGRCPGETGRPAEQSQWNQPVTGIAHRQEDRRVRLQNRVVSTTARRATHAISRNSEFKFFLNLQNMVFCITRCAGSSGAAGLRVGRATRWGASRGSTRHPSLV